MQYNKNIGMLLIIFLLALLSSLFFVKKEGFSTFGEYPMDQNRPLLHDAYPLKNPPELVMQSSSDIYKQYPAYSAGSTEINNVKFWKTPNNGKCSPAEFCGAYYKEKQIPINSLLAPNPEWAAGRVNYYVS